VIEDFWGVIHIFGIYSAINLIIIAHGECSTISRLYRAIKPSIQI